MKPLAYFIMSPRNSQIEGTKHFRTRPKFKF